MKPSPRLSIAVPIAIFMASHAPMVRAEGFSPSVRAQSWTHGSVPSAETVVDGRVTSPVRLLEIPGMHNAEVHWYSPRAVVKDSDLDPTLTDDRGAQNNRDVLAISIPRRPLTGAPSDTLWISLTSVLDPIGIDISGWGSIEFWVNDWRDESRVRGPRLKLHVDLGQVSEDQMRAPDLQPNQRLDSEDRPPRDNVLLPAEDTGIDGTDDSATDALSTPLDLVTASAIDRAGDDYGPPNDTFQEIDPRRWIRANGTEGNRLASPQPDGEDLNFNGLMDVFESYYEYTIDLSDGSQRYLVSDVFEEFAGQAVPHPPGSGNGWRRYRIPLDDAARVQFGEPDLQYVRHLRIWVEGILLPDAMDMGTGEMRPILMLAGIARTPSPQELIHSGAPNPFVSSTTFAYRLETSARVRTVVLDLQGREIAVLEEGNREPGSHSIVWNGRRGNGELAHPGVYFVRARFEGGRDRLWRVVRLP